MKHKKLRSKKCVTICKHSRLRSRIWGIDKEKFSNYAETAKVASFLLKKIANRRKKGYVNNSYIHKQVLSYFRIQRKLEPVLPKEVLPTFDIPKPLIYDVGVGFPYYELDEKIEMLRSVYKGSSSGYLVRSSISNQPEFNLNLYSYLDTFKDFVSIVDGSEHERYFPEVIIEPVYDKSLGGFFFSVYPITDNFGNPLSGGEGGAGGSGGDFSKVGDMSGVSKKAKEIIREEPSNEQKLKEYKKDLEAKIFEVDLKRKELERLREDVRHLREQKRLLLEDLKSYKVLGLKKEVKGLMKELSEITREIYRLNRQYLKLART